MKLVIPKQHGAWAMLVIPFLLSVILGKPTIYHIPLFIAWFFIYLATYPFLMYIKQNEKRVFTCSNCVFYHRFCIWDDFSII